MVNSRSYSLLAIFILYSACCSLAGWFLSAVQGLITAAFLAIFGFLFIGLGVAAIRARDNAKVRKVVFQRYLRRFRRPLPLLFVLIAILIPISGAAYPVDFQDALSYRIPRIYEWLHAGHWHWISYFDERQNNRGAGFEWMAVPLILITGTDRFLFFLNYVPYLLLPSLIFNTFRQLGVSPKVAWIWMWLAPTGLCYVLQAATAANDTLAGFFALAAMNLAINAGRSQRGDALMLALLASALATGIKATALFLLPALMLALVPALGLLRRWSPAYMSVVFLTCVLCSVVPNAFFNYQACGDWSGLQLDKWRPTLHASWLIKFAISSVLLVVQNLTPPVLSFYWLHEAEAGFLNSSLGHFVTQRYEFGELWPCGLTPIDNAGVGLPIAVLVACSAVIMLRNGLAHPPSAWWDQRGLLRGVGFACLVLVLGALNLFQVARVAGAFYLLALPFFLASPALAHSMRSRALRALAVMSGLVAIFHLVFDPVRPLIPVNVTETMARAVPFEASDWDSMCDRGQHHLGDLTWLYGCLPQSVSRVGLLRIWYEKESPLWYPYRQRQVLCIWRTDTASSLRARGMEYAVISSGGLATESNFKTPEEWCAYYHGTEVTQHIFDNGDVWTVVRLEPLPGSKS